MRLDVMAFVSLNICDLLDYKEAMSNTSLARAKVNSLAHA